MIFFCHFWRASIFEFRRRPFFPPQDKDRRAVGSGVTTATLPVFSRPGFTKDGESSVLGFANAPARSLRIYDWTYQYADHETWSGAPRLPCPSRSPSSSLGTSVSLSLFDKHRVPPHFPRHLSSLALRLYLSLFSRCSSSRQRARRNIGCFGESVSAVMPKQY